MLTLKKNYFPLIDVARFFSALSVVFFHYFSVTASELPSGAIRLYLENAFFGVQLFFIISGFVIYFSLFSDIKNYIVGRFLRIYPLFWFCMTTTYLVTLFFSEKHVSPLIYLYNLLVVNTGKTALMVDGSYWTLTHEILFYSYVGIFVYIFGVKRIEIFFYGWLALLSLGVFSGLYNMFLFKVILIRSGFYFIFGGLLALLFQHWKTSSPARKIAPIFGMLWSVFMVMKLSYFLNNESGVITNHFGMYTILQEYIVAGIFVSMCVIVTLSRFVTSKKNITVALALGSITYPLYLLHQVIGSILLGKIGVYGYISWQSVVFICLLVMFSYFLAKREKKVRVWLQKKMVSLQ